MNAMTGDELPNGQTRQVEILVVDDVEGNRAILCRRLEHYGYQHRAVESGQEALDLLQGYTPDIILLDYMMPNLNGVDVLRILRDDRLTKHIPVIMVTARTESNAVAEALAAGADDYVTKPIDFTVLKARIDSQLAKCLSSEHLRQANAALDNRVALRALELAEMQDALKSEISKRETLELQKQPDAASPALPAKADAQLYDPEIGQALDRVDEICRSIYAAVSSSKNPNLALVAEARAHVASIQQRLRGKSGS